jgi:hypothetical protein
MTSASQILGSSSHFLGEVLNVFPQGFPLLLPATLQIPGIARLYVRALKVAGKNILEVLLTIN